ncbi:MULTISPECIES: amidohydrolase family protein [unclassified Nocardioides]|uniref:amidohydrolase family protein n=1 Tax=unclassified Nocardioides TaxID=2615069 RepID=UPI00360F759A
MLDVHTHFFPRHLPPPSDRALADGWPELAPDGDLVEVRQQGRVVRVLDATAWDATARLAAMDRLGVDHHVVLPTPFTFLYDADPDIAGDYARAQNDVLAELVASGQGRLTGFGSVPLQDPEAAVAEVGRMALELGLAGVGIGTHADLFELHSPELEPVFARIEQLDLPVFVHPWKPMAPTRTSHHGLAFGLGRPVETELAVGSLVFGGVLERHPDLRVCLAHGGAGIPAIRGRLANGWSRQPVDTRTPRAGPRHLLARLWADGLTYDPAALALAASTFGPEHMVVGSDFPFDAQESPIGASFVNGVAAGLLPYGRDWAEVTTRNARTFLGSADPTTHFLGDRGEEHPIGAER